MKRSTIPAGALGGGSNDSGYIQLRIIQANSFTVDNIQNALY